MKSRKLSTTIQCLWNASFSERMNIRSFRNVTTLQLDKIGVSWGNSMEASYRSCLVSRYFVGLRHWHISELTDIPNDIKHIIDKVVAESIALIDCMPVAIIDVIIAALRLGLLPSPGIEVIVEKWRIAYDSSTIPWLYMNCILVLVFSCWETAPFPIRKP